MHVAFVVGDDGEFGDAGRKQGFGMKNLFNLKRLALAGGLALAVVGAAVAQSSAPTTTQSAPSNTTQSSAPSQPANTNQNSPAASQPAASPTIQTPSTASQPAATNGSQPAASTDNPPASATPDETGAQETSKQKDKEYKHDGGKNDIDAIGNRKIGGRGLGDWYSLEREISMGKQYAQQIEQSMKLVQDPVVNEYVNRIGQNLVRNSDAKVPFTIKVVDDDSINAFALPGGFFYVNSGLLLAADEEAEMAGVMAHETAHVCARHGMRQQTRGNWANIATLPLIFVGGGIGYAARMAANLLVPTTFMKFSRSFEAEADYLGLEYMYKTGYDPQAFISFFEKVEATEKKKPGTMSKL